jgi:hypothetical protein
MSGDEGGVGAPISGEGGAGTRIGAGTGGTAAPKIPSGLAIRGIMRSG